MAGEEHNRERLPGPMETTRTQGRATGEQPRNQAAVQSRNTSGDPLRQSPREQGVQRTLFGGMSLRARLSTVTSLGLLAIAATGALYYTADRKSSEILEHFNATLEAQSHINIIQGAALAALQHHQTLLEQSGANNHIKDYDRGMEVVNHNLKALIEIPATKDGQKTVLTLNDGFTQHAVHFHKAAQLAALLGPGVRTGLISNARTLGDKLEIEVAKAGRTGLTQNVAQLRRMEAASGRPGAHPSPGTIAGAVRSLTQALGQAPIDAKPRAGLLKLAGAYGADLGQLIRVRQTLDTEVARLEEINAYVTPNIQTLAEFGGNLALSARQSAGETQTFIRKFLAGTSAAILIVFVAIAALLMGSVTRPVRLLAHASSFLARGNQGANIPALGNYDETGEIAHALVQIRENMAHAQRFRDELELRLENAEIAAAESARAAAEAEIQAASATEEETEAAPEEQLPTSSAPAEVLAPATGLENLSTINISGLSRQLAETSQSAAGAAHEAERTEMIINGIADSLDKIEQTETLLAGIADQMSLLVVQSQLTEEDGLAGDQENLILLADKRLEEETGQRAVGQSLSDRIGLIQSGANQAIRSVRQIGQTIVAVNEVALEFAAESSSDALDAATVLLQQSEELRGKLDNLLGKIKLEGGGLPNYSTGDTEEKH